MAEPRMDQSSADDTESVRPFDRQALQATLADALRTATVETGEVVQPTAAAPSPVFDGLLTPGAPPPLRTSPAATAPGPTVASPVSSPVTGSLPAVGPDGFPPGADGLDLDIVLPRANPNRSPNPFGPTKAPAPAAPEAPAGPAPVAGPKPLPSLLGGAAAGGFDSRTIGGLRGLSGLGAPATMTSDLGARQVSAMTEEPPPPQATIALRRPQSGPERAGSAPAAAIMAQATATLRAAAEGTSATATLNNPNPVIEAPAAEVSDGVPMPPAAPIDTWQSNDDDILPGKGAKQSFRLARR